MAKLHYTYCRGVRCLLRSNCKRYLGGQYVHDEGNKQSWIDYCDEEERDFFDPQQKSQ